MQFEPFTHGGPDAQGVPLHDFSTNANAAGPCPLVWAAVRQVDASTYPDPTYTALRKRLALFHGVAPGRVVLTASASEALFRWAAAARQLGHTTAWMPDAHYGDVGRASQAWGLRRADAPNKAGVIWACEPSTPAGQNPPGLADTVAALQVGQALLLDRAYEPLRLDGAPSLDPSALNGVWQLWSPNKALGLTGVRGAYLLAPAEDTDDRRRWLQALNDWAPSWPLGAHAVAMLDAWCQPEVQAWLSESRTRLVGWKQAQVAALQSQGWTCLPSEANFFLARPPEAWLAQLPLSALLARWRAVHSVKLRDAASFGHEGWVRLGVRPPVSPSIWGTLSA